MFSIEFDVFESKSDDNGMEILGDRLLQSLIVYAWGTILN